jgi:diguanylate cyclase (GGDEF)-like protein/PAS domain S-box-containing protein
MSHRWSAPVRWFASRGSRLMIFVVVGVVTLVMGTVGGLALYRVDGAAAQVRALSGKNVARLTLLGEIRGEQARINDGVANLFAPGRTPALLAVAKEHIAAAAAAMNRDLEAYHALVRGSKAESGLRGLTNTWRMFYNGLNVYILGRAPFPGWPMIAGPEHLGEMTVSMMDGLDAQAAAERTDAAAVGATARVAQHQTNLQVGLSLIAGLLLALSVSGLALRAETARRRGERRFEALVRSSSDVIAVVSEDGRQTYLSPSAEAVMGYRPADLTGEHFTVLLHPEDADRAAALHASIAAGDAAEHRFDMRLRHGDGSWRWHELVARNLLLDPAVRGVVINHRDITERREFQDRLAYEASHDALTDLANRAAFLCALDDALAQARTQGHRSAVLYVDLNEFKQVNDTWGHDAGDAVLVGVAQVLRRSVLGADTVARLGGDEFGIVLAHIDADEHAEAVARRITAGLVEELPIGGGRHVRAGASIGIAVSRPDQQADDLLRQADTAMYGVKAQKINGWRSYVESHG